MNELDEIYEELQENHVDSYSAEQFRHALIMPE